MRLTRGCRRTVSFPRHPPRESTGQGYRSSSSKPAHADARDCVGVSEENVETVRRIFELVNQGAFDELAAFTPADFELDLSRSRGLNTRVYRAEESSRLWEGLTEAWAEYEFFETEMIDAGDIVVRVGGLRGRGKGSGLEVEAEGASVWSFRDGSLISGALFQSRAEALEAAGLPG